MKRLCVFDFDGTLFDSPMPEIGIPMWEKYYNKPYPDAQAIKFFKQSNVILEKIGGI